MSDNTNPAAIAAALAAPFDAAEVKFKPQAVSGNRALAVPYVDARVIQDRLDEVLGVMGWQDSYECLPDGAVVCRLRIRIGDEWIEKQDVGSPSEQPDEGDRRKAAFSDALKRAAVKLGIGRYLYRSKPQWVDYDPAKRQFTQPPRLPGAPSANGHIGNGHATNGNGHARPSTNAPSLPADGITQKQVEDLELLCRSRGKAIKAVCRRFGVTDPKELTAGVYAKAVEGLNALPPGPAVRAAAPAAS